MSKILRVRYVSVLEFFQMLPLTLQGLIIFSFILIVQYHNSGPAVICVVHRPGLFLSDPSTRNDKFFSIPQVNKNKKGYSCNKSQRDALFLTFILIKNSTCFGQIYCPSSGVSTMYTHQQAFVILVMLTVCQRQLADSQHN